VRLCHRFQ